MGDYLKEGVAMRRHRARRTARVIALAGMLLALAACAGRSGGVAGGAGAGGSGSGSAAVMGVASGTGATSGATTSTGGADATDRASGTSTGASGAGDAAADADMDGGVSDVTSAEGAPPDDGGSAMGDAGTYVGYSEGGVVPTTITSANWDETLYPFAKRRMLVRDMGSPSIHLLDLGLPAGQQDVWSTRTDGPWGHGMQLVGNNQLLVGRADGYEVHDLGTGAMLKEVVGFANTQSVYRMASGETLLARTGATFSADASSPAILLDLLDAHDQVVRPSIAYAGYGYVRAARPTRSGTFMVPSDTTLFEGDRAGNVLWTTTGTGWGHIFEALPAKGGNIVLATGFGASLDVIDPTTHKVTFRYGTRQMPDAAVYLPNYFQELQVLPNGNLVASNHLGTLGGQGVGMPIIEFDPTGKVVWSYKLDPTFSAIEGILVLDGLDPQYLHVQETEDGTWQPVR